MEIPRKKLKEEGREFWFAEEEKLEEDEEEEVKPSLLILVQPNCGDGEEICEKRNVFEEFEIKKEVEDDVQNEFESNYNYHFEIKKEVEDDVQNEFESNYNYHFEIKKEVEDDVQNEFESNYNYHDYQVANVTLMNNQEEDTLVPELGDSKCDILMEEDKHLNSQDNIHYTCSKQECHLLSHMRKHVHKKPFYCNECQKSFPKRVIRRRKGLSNLGRKTRRARQQAIYQSKRTVQEREKRNEIERIRLAQTRRRNRTT